MVVTQYRFKAKRWPADAVQLFAQEYQHSNLEDHEVYQYRRYKYARKGLVAPRANDYDTEDEDLTQRIADMIPEVVSSEDKETFSKDFKEAYLDYRREQIVAKDDFRSPHYFSDDEEAKQKALEEASTAAVAKMQQRMMDKTAGTLSCDSKHKILSDNNPPEYNKATSYLSSYIPPPEPVTYPEWESYSVSFPLSPVKINREERTGMPLGLPKWREPQLREDGSAIAKGGRKNAAAEAVVRRGTGKIQVNGKELVEYFRPIDARDAVLAPLLVTESLLSFDINVKVTGGGVKGQAGACRHAISKALEKFDPSFRLVLKSAGLLTRDPRVVERKKPGKAGARKSFQWVKR